MELEDSLRAGTLLCGGKYRIVNAIGQGGFGITYKAKMKLEAQGAIGKMIVESDVAIKEFFIKSECERDENSNAVTVPSKKKAGFIEDYRKKFFNEANNLSRLNHENIVKVIDTFEENSTAYFVMEYIDGESLDAMVEKQGAMSESKAKEVIGQLAKAVDYIHHNKFTHLDIKPANILVNEMGCLKLVDFGLSKHYDSVGKQTTLGATQGVSEGFSPVEQYEVGALKSFSPQSDIYSVGATMAYLLTGKVPPSATKSQLPALPSSISETVKYGIYAAMANKASDRPQTIGEFMQMIGGNLQPQIGKLTSGIESKGWSSKDNVPQPCVYGPPIPRNGNDSNGIKVINEGGDDKKPSKLVYWFILVIIGLVIFIFFVKDCDGPSSGQEDIVVDTCAVDTCAVVFEDVTEEAAVVEEVTEETNHLSGLSDKTITVNGVSFKMVAVKGGTFTMGEGSDAYLDEEPTHSVTLSDYYIGETEVTQALWVAVMGSNPSEEFKGSNLPVESVSWDDCQDFINKLNSLTGLNFRLPTEAEWEYAARGGNKSKGYKYSGSNNIDHVAWYYDNSGYEIHAVKQKQANELGLYDMSGNVEEWCLDWEGDYSSSSQTNPTGPSSGHRRVLRGGSWSHNALACRVSRRDGWGPGSRYSKYGLRVCLPSL